MGFYVANGWGDSIHSPSQAEMRRFLDEIDLSDEEHGAAWLSTDGGTSLEWNGDGRLVFAFGASDVRHLRDVSRERALALWAALADGRLDEIERGAWEPGNGYVRTAERDAELRAWQQAQDREFYDSLGPERSDVRCRADGCARGAVSLSVLCRVHHFGSIKKRPSPFAH
jgi:hypothetical protein